MGTKTGMNKTAQRLLATFVIAGATLFPTLALAQGANGFEVQILWNGNRPYYWDQSHHRHYLTGAEAQQYAQREYPDWYRTHQGDWNGNHDRFMSAWHQWDTSHSQTRYNHGQ